MTYTVWFHDYRPEHAPRVGGKCSSLGELTRAGLPVPPGFAITTEAYHWVHRHTDVSRALREMLDGSFDVQNLGKLEAVSLELRGLVESTPVPAEVEDAFAGAYAELAQRCGDPEVAVAVRSSATSEDLPEASFAGEHETYLWVRGERGVATAVRRCWSSLFTERAIAYRHEMGYPHDLVHMSVAVQKMARPKAAGVAFTLNPRNGDRSQVAIEGSWGFGEAVVAGEVTPDSYLVDKVMREITRRQVSAKEWEYRLAEGGDGVERVPITDERRDLPCLTDDEVKAVAALARSAERWYGCPQDVEWAVDADLPDGENTLLLQSRPETVWSRRASAPAVPAQQDYMSSIVATLVAPMHARKAGT